MTRAADLAELGSAYAGVNPFSLRNRLINGNFDIWQRGTAFTSVANDAYTSDRWMLNYNGTGGKIDVSRQSFAAGVFVGDFDTEFYMRTVATTLPTGCTYVSQVQRIESFRQLGGKRVTVSFLARANATKTGSIGIRQSYGSGGSAMTTSGQQSFTMGTTFQKFTFQVDIPSNVGKTIGTGAYQEFFIQIVNPSSGDYFDISQVQVELGSVATPFEYRPYGLELSLCQRYYITSNQVKAGVPPYPGRGNIDNSSAQAAYTFPTPMRTVPTVTYTCAPQTSGGATYATIYGFVANSSLNVSGPSNFLGYTANAEL